MKTKIPAVLALLLVSNALSTPLYNVIDLGINATPYSINNNGQIVGWVSSMIETRHAVFFDSTGGGNNIFLYTLPGWHSSAATSINDSGQIVGGNDYEGAIIFDSTGGENHILLGPLPGGRTGGGAWAINNNGQIVGSAYITSSQFSNYRATLFDATGAGNNIHLGTLSDGYDSTACSINDNGQIVGYARRVSLGDRAVLFDPTGGGDNINLGVLPGGTNSWAYSINNSGLIVGWSWTDNGELATLFDITGAGNNINLGLGRAYAVNNKGQIVGWSSGGATLFDATGAGNNINLNTLINPSLGWSLQRAFDINDDGWIVGEGINPAGKSTAFLLFPVPEPATFLPLSFGAAGIRFRRFLKSGRN